MKPHYDVLIATPGVDMVADYVLSLVETLAECSKRGITFKLLNGRGALIHHTRELTLTNPDKEHQLNGTDRGPMGDKVTYNKLFWIDSDISWSPEDFFKLYDSEEDIITGAYLLINEDKTSVHDYASGKPMVRDTVVKLKGVIEVDAGGFGFLCVKSGVFENTPRPWFALYQQNMGNGIIDTLGEDVSWMIKAKKAGYKIMFDTSVLVDHVKTKKLVWRKNKTNASNF